MTDTFPVEDVVVLHEDINDKLDALAKRVGELTDAVNQVGQQQQWMVETVGAIMESFKSMNPLEFVKGLTKRGG